MKKKKPSGWQVKEGTIRSVFCSLFPEQVPGASSMVLNALDKKSILEVLDDVRPYIIEITLVEQLNVSCMESSNSVKEFINKLEQQENKIEDSVLRTDLRIYIGRLKKNLKV